MKLYFVGDGPRDAEVVPHIVVHVTGRKFTRKYMSWKDITLHGRGFDKKLKVSLAAARNEDYDGVVATVDRDKDRKKDRLRRLQQVRAVDRTNPTNIPMPVALGEADPHLESWLLDDNLAVKTVLQIQSTKSIPTIPHKDPKGALNKLIIESLRQEKANDLLGEIASILEPSRCRHSSTTGLKQFVDDVRREFPSP